jgi:hypothetical protein
MTTLTINERTKAGKLLLEMAKLLSENSKDVVILESGEVGYDAEFVEKVKKSAASKERYQVENVDELWESL